jgi:hypothetical protein
MKKIVLFIMLAVSMAAISANELTLNDGKLYYKYDGTAADTSSVYTTWNKIVAPNATYALFYNFAVKITEVTATTATDVTLQGMKFDNGTYVPIDTVRYYGTGADTTILFTQESTKQFYNYYKIISKPANGKVKTTYIRAFFRK